MKSFVIYIGFLCSVVIAGRAAGSDISRPEIARGQKFQKIEIPQGKAVIYVYRVRTGFMAKTVSGAATAVFINGKPVGTEMNGGYLVWFADPGEVVASYRLPAAPPGVVWTYAERMAAFKRDAALTFVALADHEYYVEWKDRMELREYSAAANVLTKCRFQGIASAAVAPQFKELPPIRGYARLYFLNLRVIYALGPVLSPIIKVDGHKIGWLQTGTYLACYAPTGTHQIDAVGKLLAAPGQDAKLTITASADESLFFRWALSGGNVLETTWRFDQLGHDSNGLTEGLKANNSDYDVLTK